MADTQDPKELLSGIEITKENAENTVDSLFRLLVPTEGKADTVAGEIIRALCRLGHEYYNNGDYFFSSRSNDGVKAVATFLTSISSTFKDTLEDTVKKVEPLISDDGEENGPEADEKYDECIKNLCVEVLTYLKNHTSLFDKENTKDYLDEESILYTEDPSHTLSIDTDGKHIGEDKNVVDYIEDIFIQPLFEYDENVDDIKVEVNKDGVVSVSNLTISQVRTLKEEGILDDFWEEYDKYREMLAGEDEDEIEIPEVEEEQ